MCVSVYADLNTSAEEAYKLALDSIFVRKAEVHRFVMPNKSRKHPHKARWTLFEMWPINVSTYSMHLDMVSTLHINDASLCSCVSRKVNAKTAMLVLSEHQQDSNMQVGAPGGMEKHSEQILGNATGYHRYTCLPLGTASKLNHV